MAVQMTVHMKYLLGYLDAVTDECSYVNHIDEAVKAINASVNYNRVANDPTPDHTAEREAIITNIEDLFKVSKEKIVEDLIDHPYINSRAVDDYMLYHHPTFPGNKACRIPANKIDAARLGFHINAIISGDASPGINHNVTHMELEPAFTLAFYDEDIKDWTSFRVKRTEVYTMAKNFIHFCIAKNMPYMHKNGKDTDFGKVQDYIQAYAELNKLFIPRFEQHNSIGWNKDKTAFISPRDKSKVLVLGSAAFQAFVDEGYILKNTTGKNQNMNDMLRLLVKYPLGLAVYAAAFVAPIINGYILDVNGITIDIYGIKGKGKNLLQSAATNPIGFSGARSKLIGTWMNASVPGISSLISFNNGHPVFLEESHKADPAVAEFIIYNVHNSNMAIKSEQAVSSDKIKSLTVFLYAQANPPFLSL